MPGLGYVAMEVFFTRLERNLLFGAIVVRVRLRHLGSYPSVDGRCVLASKSPDHDGPVHLGPDLHYPALGAGDSPLHLCLLEVAARESRAEEVKNFPRFSSPPRPSLSLRAFAENDGKMPRKFRGLADDFSAPWYVFFSEPWQHAAQTGLIDPLCIPTVERSLETPAAAPHAWLRSSG